VLVKTDLQLFSKHIATEDSQRYPMMKEQYTIVGYKKGKREPNEGMKRKLERKVHKHNIQSF